MIKSATITITLAAVATLIGCRKAPQIDYRAGAPVSQPSEHSAAVASTTISPSRTFENSQHGFRIQFPSNWSERPSEDYVLVLAPADAKADESSPSISMDVPSLPPHLPGMIRISLIQNGFMDNLREKYKEVKIGGSEDIQFPAAKARRLQTSWKTADGRQFKQDALLMIHANRVYILRGTAQESEFDRTDAAFEQVRSSLQWLK